MVIDHEPHRACALLCVTTSCPIFQQFRRCSPFTRPPFTPAHHSAPLRPWTFIPLLFTIHSPILHSRPSVPAFTPPPSHPPFTTPPFTLNFTLARYSAALHSHLSFRRTDNLSLSSSSSCNRERTATPDLLLVDLREATNLSTERRTATCNLRLVEQNSYRSRSHSITYIRHPSSY
jgi:hypothetical protein